MKKLKLIRCALVLIVCLFAGLTLFACSSEDVEDDGGIYAISTAEDLIAFSESVNNGKTYEGQIVNQVSDINLGGVEFTPIGLYDSGNYFYGTYNGNGYTINNLYIDTTDYGGNNGLFGQLGGIIVNLNINGYISGNCCGSFASHGLSSDSKIINCHSTVTILANRCGGIADNFIGSVYGCSYYNEESPLPIVGYNALGVYYSCTNSSEVVPETFGGKSKDIYTVSDEENLEESINSNLAFTSVSGGVELNKLTKFGTSETSSFLESLTEYPTKTLKVYYFHIIAVICLIVAIAVVVAIFIIEEKRKKRTL